MTSSMKLKEMEFNEFSATLYAKHILSITDGRYDTEQKQEVLELVFNIKYQDFDSYIEDRYDTSLATALTGYFGDSTSKMICDTYARYTHPTEEEAIEWLKERLNVN